LFCDDTGKAKYGDDVYGMCLEVFNSLPLAAIIKTKDKGDFFCVHGGLSPSVKTVCYWLFLFRRRSLWCCWNFIFFL